MNRIAGGLGVLFLAWLAMGSVFGVQDTQAKRAAARAAFVGELEHYVAWCQEKNLFNERRKGCELLIELAPDQAEARKFLGYVKDKSGAWKAPEKPKAFKDYDKKALAEAPGKWKEATAGYVAALVAILEQHELALEERQLVAQDAVRFDPDNERLHAALGDVKSDKGWVLPETLRAKAQREALREHVQHALGDAVAAQPVALLEREKKIPLELSAVAAPGVRVVGTVGSEEMQLTAQAVQGVEYLLQHVFVSRYALPRDTTVFLFSDPAQRTAFVSNHPAIAPERRADFERLEGGGIPGTDDFAFWTGDSQRRIDGIVRLVLGFWLSGAFQIHTDIGWAYEGFGLYLTRSLVRTRMTWLAQPSKVFDRVADMTLRQKLIDPATNWMDEALRLVLEGRRPAYPELFAKDAGELATEDVLYSYALVTYLLEARPDDTPKLLDKLGNGASRTAAFQETLGMDFATFDRHFKRWLEERK